MGCPPAQDAVTTRIIPFLVIFSREFQPKPSFVTGILGGTTQTISNIAGWKMGAPDWVDVFPIKNGDIPASYVSLPEGIPIHQTFQVPKMEVLT